MDGIFNHMYDHRAEMSGVAAKRIFRNAIGESVHLGGVEGKGERSVTLAAERDADAGGE